MLDPRIYQAALVPVVLAVIVAAFSIETPPGGLRATLPPDSFSGDRALAELHTLATAFPSRQPGGPGDAALARRVREQLRGAGLQVAVTRASERTVRGRRELTTVTAERIGRSSRRLVVVASRDALSRPAVAQLSGTAALLELARVFEGRTLRKTLVLISTSGGSGGAAGAARAAGRLSSVDGVLVLGDLAGDDVRRPVVVPWSNDPTIAPPSLRSTAGTAVRQETGLRPGSPGLLAQFAHLAFPYAPGEQGQILAAGLPAVLISVSGERGPGNAGVAGADRFGQFGRAALRALTALDGGAGAPAPPRAELLAAGKLLPGWAVRLVVGALVLPALLAAIDGFARMRRRRHPVGMWIVWVGASALPFALALGFAWLLTAIGLTAAAPPAAAPAEAAEMGIGGLAALACVTMVAVISWLVLRPAVLRAAGVRGDPASPGAAAALALVLVATVAAVWVFNPFAAALLLAPLHGWMLLAAPEVRVRRAVALGLVALTLLPVALVALFYALTLGAGPLQLVWGALLAAVGGQVGLPGALAWSLLAGCLAAMLAIVLRKRLREPVAPGPITRGPITYAGPGSLGGTESALRVR